MTTTPTYVVWCNMKSRCNNPKNERYHRYGGRGIRVCDRWMQSFENFLADMGQKPSGDLTLERKNNDGDYEPGNCVWAAQVVQDYNKNNTVRFEGKTAREWSEELGVTPRAIRKRLIRTGSVYSAKDRRNAAD